MGCIKMAEILAKSVYYIFRDYLIMLTYAHIVLTSFIQQG